LVDRHGLGGRFVASASAIFMHGLVELQPVVAVAVGSTNATCADSPQIPVGKHARLVQSACATQPWQEYVSGSQSGFELFVQSVFVKHSTQ
jgi:hypothetical protein